MHDHVAKPDRSPPRHFWMRIAKPLRDVGGSFPDDLEPRLSCGGEDDVIRKTAQVAGEMFLDVRATLENVLEALAVASQRATASFSTASRIRGRSPATVVTMTSRSRAS